MPPPPSPSEAASAAHTPPLQPSCSSSSSGITCTHTDNLGQNHYDADDASSDKEADTSDSLGTTWTDSKHSSYLDFMEQNFVRDLYEREYCALDVCGQPSQRHEYVDNEDIHDPDTAESRFPASFGPMEFKVWEDGNWTRLLDSKPKMHPWSLLSNPWFKHFQTRASCGSSVSNVSLPRSGPIEPQFVSSQHRTRNTKQDFRGMEMGPSSVCRESSELKAKHCNHQQTFLHRDSRPQKRTVELDSSEQGTSTRCRARCTLDEGSMTIGLFGEICKRGDGSDNYCYYSGMPHCGDG